jgi:hypothetical protein
MEHAIVLPSGDLYKFTPKECAAIERRLNKLNDLYATKVALIKAVEQIVYDHRAEVNA